jgi:hypothetical protein
MIWMSYFLGLALSFSQTLRGMTFEEALESTIQLWTFLLNISKVNKKGGVVYFDLFPMRDALTTNCFFGAMSFHFRSLMNFPFPLFPPTLAS